MGSIKLVSAIVALLAGLLIAAAACGGDGKPQATTTGTPGTPAVSGSQSGTAMGSPPAGTTAGPATTATSSASATPGSAALTPAATVSESASLFFGYDMDVAGNSATALGEVDRCVQVSAEDEDEFQVDVFIDMLIQDSMAGFQYDIGFPDNVVEVVGQDHAMLLVQEPEANTVDLGDSVPDSSSPHLVAFADLGTAEFSPPYTQGVVGRYTFRVLPTAPSGFYALTLTTVVAARSVEPSLDFPDYPLGGEIPIATVWDGNFSPQYGVIAVDVPCG
jgi:hypothetical protein